MRPFAQNIVEMVRHPLLFLNAELRLVIANRRFYESFELSPPATENHAPAELEILDADPALRAMLQRVMVTGEPLEDFVWERSPQSYLISARRVEREEDYAPMILVAIEAVTATNEMQRLNRKLEELVSQRTAQQEAANRELEAFSYSVSHDLRTPLRAIDGFSGELLRQYGGLFDNRGRHYLERVRAGTQRMGVLIDDLLKLSRINRCEIRREWVDLSEIAREAAEELQAAEPKRRVEFQIEPHLKAWGDASLLRIALDNLLGNAWKFTAKKELAMVTVDRVEHSGGPVFRVRDNGAGFDMSYAGKLFGAFQRLHSERDFPGTGIGLATVQRVIRRHEGRIWADSTPDQGAVFYFTLPGSNSHG